MSNIFEDIGHGIKVGAEDVGKAVVDVVTFLPHAEQVIATAIKEQPQVKTAVTALISQASTVIADLGADALAKGINLASDAKTLADAEAFFSYFVSTFIPLVESVYEQVKTDIGRASTLSAS